MKGDVRRCVVAAKPKVHRARTLSDVRWAPLCSWRENRTPGLEVEGVDRHLHTGLEDPERTQPTDPRGVLEEALNKTADITAVQLKIGILERLETGLGQIELTERQRAEWREFLTQIIDGGAPDRTPEETVSQIAGASVRSR